MNKEIKIPEGWRSIYLEMDTIKEGDKVYNYSTKKFEKITNDNIYYITEMSIIIRKN